MKCQAMENTYSKNSSVIPQKFPFYRSCIKSSISILKYYQINQIWDQNNPYTCNFNYQFNYSIPFSICHNTTKWKELFSLTGTTFVYVLSSDWLNYWFDTWIWELFQQCGVFFFNFIYLTFESYTDSYNSFLHVSKDWK